MITYNLDLDVAKGNTIQGSLSLYSVQGETYKLTMQLKNNGLSYNLVNVIGAYVEFKKAGFSGSATATIGSTDLYVIIPPGVIATASKGYGYLWLNTGKGFVQSAVFKYMVDETSDGVVDAKIAEAIEENNEAERLISDEIYQPFQTATVVRTATGADRTLVDTINAPIISLQLGGHTGQLSAPTLIAPQVFIPTANSELVLDDAVGAEQIIAIPGTMHGVYASGAPVFSDKIIVNKAAGTVIKREELASVNLEGAGTWAAYTAGDHTGGEAKCYSISFTGDFSNSSSWAGSAANMMCTHLPYNSQAWSNVNAVSGCCLNPNAKTAFFKIRTDTVINGETIDSLQKWTEALSYLAAFDEVIPAVLVPRSTPIETNITATALGQALLGLRTYSGSTVLSVISSLRAALTYKQRIIRTVRTEVGTFAARPTFVSAPTFYIATDKTRGAADRLTYSSDGATWLQLT